MKIKEEVKTLKPYFVDEKPVRFKLDANESPFDLSEEDKEEIFKELSAIQTNRYPNPSVKNLRRLVAKKEGISEDAIVFGNGSDEIIYMLYMCLKDRAGIMFPAPGFSIYSLGAKIFRKKLMPYKLKEPFYELDEDFFWDTLSNEPDLVFVANPNNPTGNLFPRDVLLSAMKRYQNTLFVSDEAYFDYAGTSLISELKNHKNLLIMRSFSKVGFASIRLGYILGDESIIQHIAKVRLPYNINSYTQKVAEFFFKRIDLIKKQTSDIIKERERVIAILRNHNVFVLPSEANFVTFKIEKSGFYDYLLDNGLLIKDLSHSFGMKSFYRLTIGKAEENDFFIKLFSNFIEGV